MIMETLLKRVNEESVKYDTMEEAAIDHLNMAHAHIFEESEGRDILKLLSSIEELVTRLETKRGDYDGSLAEKAEGADEMV